VAAVGRAQVALAEYRNVPALEEALFILVRSYDAMGLHALRDDARRVLEKNYPNSEYLARGFKASSDPWWKIW
jgi:outer membrane protein assembly factor BamD